VNVSPKAFPDSKGKVWMTLKEWKGKPVLRSKSPSFVVVPVSFVRSYGFRASGSQVVVYPIYGLPVHVLWFLKYSALRTD